MSTMLLIERMPTLSIFARNQSGDGPTLTLSILRAEKNGHSFGAEILIDAVAAAVAGGSFVLIFFPVSAEISRASQ
jgi:hypothetical protein